MALLAAERAHLLALRGEELAGHVAALPSRAAGCGLRKKRAPKPRGVARHETRRKTIGKSMGKWEKP